MSIRNGHAILSLKESRGCPILPGSEATRRNLSILMKTKWWTYRPFSTQLPPNSLFLLNPCLTMLGSRAFDRGQQTMSLTVGLELLSDNLRKLL